MQRYSNVIQALVYAGAAFLVVIVGLRGLGDLSQLGFMPSWLLDESTGRISVNIVILGLIAEFAMLMALAYVFYRVPRFGAESSSESRTYATAVVSSAADVTKLIDAERQLVETLGRKIEALVDTERRVIEEIGNKYNTIADSQRQILELLARRFEETHLSEESTLKRIETTVDFLKSAHLVRRRTHSENTPTLS